MQKASAWEEEMARVSKPGVVSSGEGLLPLAIGVQPGMTSSQVRLVRD